MADKKNVKVIVTVGPSTSTEKDILRIKDKGVDFIRVNMSHSSLYDLEYFINIAVRTSIPFIIDTEGAQVRTGNLIESRLNFDEGDIVKLYGSAIAGDKEKINLTPEGIINQIEVGDLLFVDFDTLVLRVFDISTLPEGYLLAKVVTSGWLGRNKAVIINSAGEKKYHIPVLSPKDRKSIELGIKFGIKHIAVSYVKEGNDIKIAREATNNSMVIIAKVETKEALSNIDDIIDQADAILIDRGDLSKEVPIEMIPNLQKIIIGKCASKGKEAYIATNLLESMIENRKPTRAEVNDILNTIWDGASGLTISAETAIGKYPMHCINMLNKLILNSRSITKDDYYSYINEPGPGALIEPHGGKLVERYFNVLPSDLNNLPKITLNEEQQMDLEQIAIGTFSPLQGFMCRSDFESVLDRMRLVSGVLWPLPIVLDVEDSKAKDLKIGNRAALEKSNGEIVGLIYIEDIYQWDKNLSAQKLYGTQDKKHPGVKSLLGMNPVLIGGRIELYKRSKSEFKDYQLSPKQVRRIFEEKGWMKIVGFHTRNVIHKAHEWVQLKAFEAEQCDGLFVHPVIGKKKPGDYQTKYIIKTYERMMDYYPKNTVVLSSFSTYSRYAGPREALFTAICRQNYGCSHFIVGRDHTGVGDYYHPTASQEIFSRFPDLKIKPVFFNKVIYSGTHNNYLEQSNGNQDEKFKPLEISGTEARQMFEAQQQPPEWFMRPEISSIIIEAIKNKEEVFVK